MICLFLKLSHSWPLLFLQVPENRMKCVSKKKRLKKRQKKQRIRNKRKKKPGFKKKKSKRSLKRKVFLQRKLYTIA